MSRIRWFLLRAFGVQFFALDPLKPMRHREVMATELLKRAFAEAGEKLPEFEQDALAEWLLAAMAADLLWDDLLSKPDNKLERLADRALEAYKRGNVELFDHKKL